MAYINVAEWTPDHVAEWLKGLEYSILPYVHFFLNNGIDGCHLLNLIADDLEKLHIFKIGHQQLILEAVELLRQLHYNLNSETLQSLAVKLGCKARSLYNELKLNGPQDHLENIRQERVSMEILSAVSEVLTSVKLLISWLDRLPFQRDAFCVKLKKSVLKLSIELASTTQRDQFAEKPHSLIKRNSLQLAELCDKFIQDSKDSLILQPASLDIAMIKKKPDEELGIHIKSIYSGVHVIGGIKDQSPAQRCNKVEKGDEIIQVNYQTVIGWQQKKLVTAMTEHSTDVHLTLKKRPRHINILGEIIILRPYRIPSKKTASKRHKWPEENRLHVQDTCSTSNESEILRNEFDEDEDDSAFLPSGAASCQIMLVSEPPLQRRMHLGASASVQRRATVSGSSPTVLKPPVNIKDLVNGVARIKANDNIGRSISHDPSCQGRSECTENLMLVKPHVSENVDNVLVSLSKENSNACVLSNAKCDNSRTPDLLNMPNESISLSSSKCPSPVLMVDVVPVQEECTVLENKSLEIVLDPVVSKKEISSEKALNDESISSFLSEQNSCYAINFTPVTSTVVGDANHVSIEKHSTLLYDWIGADTEFCKRKPSAHDICNEIAGSKMTDINPVYLRKVSKLETPSSRYDASEVNKESIQSSYQVVVIGGVPQKSTPVLKDGKRGHESLPSHYRRKDSLVGRLANRRISCKDLGMGDCQGWLYKQKEKKGFFPSSQHWTKRWIVLKSYFLYSYRDKNDAKAECLISLPGSTVSPALECKSKKYAFKVCQQKTIFYFATESQIDLTKWMNKMGLAAIAYDATSDITTSGFLKPEVILGVTNNFYSETEDSENGSPRFQKRKGSSYGNISPVSSSSERSTDQISRPQSKLKDHSCMSEKRLSSKLSFNKEGKHYFQDRESNSYWVKQRASNAYCNEFLPESPCSFSPQSNIKYTLQQNADKKMHKISYNRCFSYTDSIHSSHKNNSKYLVRKNSHDDTCIDDPLSSYESHVVTKPNAANTWSADEGFDILTSSLGRQKSATEEIAPGLVARMAISYSNLSKKNLLAKTVTKQQNYFKAVPPPGYVAKISDSFDHIAKMGQSHDTTIYYDKRCQPRVTSSQSASYKPHPNCKRSASESYVSESIANRTRRTESLNYPSHSALTIQCLSPENTRNERAPEKFITLLDKEYYRLFEGKKVSQHQLKSQTSIGFFDKRGPGEMKFFPNDNMFNALGTKHQLPQKTTNGTNLNAKHNSNLKCSPDSGVVFDSGDHANILHGSSLQKSSSESYSRYSKDNSFAELSKGIENVGFHCPDQPNLNSFDSNASSESFSDASFNKRLSHCSVEGSSSFHENRLNIENPEEILASSKNQSFKFFSSPKFMKKLTSPKLDKKNIFKSKKQAKELKRTEQKDPSSFQNDRKFLGSPRLARAIFGSPKAQKKIVIVSSAVQTDVNPQNSVDTNIPPSQAEDTKNTCESTVLATNQDSCAHYLTPETDTVISKSSSNSSLNSNSASVHSINMNSNLAMEARAKPQITISLPLVTGRNVENGTSTPETPRTPLKPTMGIAMLSKRRLPSISGENSVSVASSKCSQEESHKECVQTRTGVSIDISEDDEMLSVLDNLYRADITIDGVDIRTRRSRTMFIPNDNKRQSQLIFSIRALQRTLKDKESELEAIQELCDKSFISHEMLVKWKSIHAPNS